MQTPGILVMSGNGREALKRLSEYAKSAEQIGLRSFLVTEGPATDGLAISQFIASVTTRIHVGTGIANIYTRHPALLAGHAIAIDALAPGRLLLGLGTSHKPVNTAYGINMDKPLTALRDCVTALRKAFRGEAMIDRPGFTAPKAEGKISVYIAGISPKSIELTGEIADGSLPLNYCPRGLKEVVDGIGRGAQRAGRDPKEVAVALIMHCCVCTDRALALKSVKSTLARYGSLPFYNRLFVRQGFVKEAEGIMAAASKGDMAGAAAAVSDGMAEQTAAMGSAADCKRKLEEFERAGAAYVLLYPVPIDGNYDRGVREVLHAFS
ncbi:MAG TPA: LLM class flavin-dependent oxidoreductase [Candidatus Binataceae bacterium]|nr:LLM class flavin-dependent oxidoreductase [Candidatus Binataceae bacterium]